MRTVSGFVLILILCASACRRTPPSPDRVRPPRTPTTSAATHSFDVAFQSAPDGASLASRAQRDAATASPTAPPVHDGVFSGRWQSTFVARPENSSRWPLDLYLRQEGNRLVGYHCSSNLRRIDGCLIGSPLDPYEVPMPDLEGVVTGDHADVAYYSQHGHDALGRATITLRGGRLRWSTSVPAMPEDWVMSPAELSRCVAGPHCWPMLNATDQARLEEVVTYALRRAGGIDGPTSLLQHDPMRDEADR
jgi:hypothetical protein